jgi:replicative DNA helicase
MDSSEKAENRQQEITRISRGVKCLAGELDAHVLCLCQLNRASESENRRPRSSDLRESGAIEQDADVVMLLHREDVLNRSNPEWFNDPANAAKIGTADLILAKQRNGPCGVVSLLADDSRVRFMNPNYS